MASSSSCGEHLDSRLTDRFHPARPHVSRTQAFSLLAGVYIYGMLGTTLPIPIYVLYQEQYSLTSFTITIIFAVYALAALVSLLLFGRLSDHFGRRPVIIAALVLGVASSFFFVLAINVPMLLAGRIVSGLSTGLLTGTATAGLAELDPKGSTQHAARVAAASTLIGLGLGPLVAGLFAQLAPYPTRLVFVVYLVLLVVVALLSGSLPETVEVRDHALDLRPRLAVPPPARKVFLQAALTMFGAYTLAGLFSSLIPSILRVTLKEENLIVAGGCAFLLFGVAALSQAVMHTFTSQRARFVGIVMLLLSLALIESGLGSVNTLLFFVGTVFCGLGMGLAMMGSLAVANQVAAPSERGGMMSALFLVAYAGLTVPVVGVGILSGITSLFAATVYLAVATALVLIVALVLLPQSRTQEAKAGYIQVPR